MNKDKMQNLLDYIRSAYSPDEKVKQSKDNGETIFFRKGGKSLCYIDTREGKSIITVVIGATLNEKVQNANISQKAKDMFTNAKQFHDGKWLLFEVTSEEDVNDIKKLLAIKRRPANS